ncbi:hypothetical protein M422DRAFT_257710 [Sphaerobolus stellatus SS14]|uniref:Uncharacterized protein n=1 Tax=Sphaerobolus stellatus (strain SS14) TaxID=990650 RepID=A0A0C9U8P7_SPHS4|nr:hypothetical protein M422DRAFT_257710 [Sphaerobolus stellatus SS14]
MENVSVLATFSYLQAIRPVAVGRLIRIIQSYDLPVSPPGTPHGSTKKIVLLARVGETVDENTAGVAGDTILRTLSGAIRVIPDIPKTVKMATPKAEESLVFRRYPGHDSRLKRSQGCQILMGGQLVVEDGRGALETLESGKEICLRMPVLQPVSSLPFTLCQIEAFEANDHHNEQRSYEAMPHRIFGRWPSRERCFDLLPRIPRLPSSFNRIRA